MANFKQASLEVLSQEGNFPDGNARRRFSQAMSQWQETVPQANVEEFYVMMELLSRMNGGGHGPDGLDDLRYLIGKTLEVKMRGNGHGDMGAAHREFLTRIPGYGRATVLTLNWDLAFETAADDIRYVVDYGYSKVRGYHGPPRPPTRFPNIPDPTVSFLKMHGSFNWWICDQCKTLWHTGARKDVVWAWESSELRRCRAEECKGNVLQPVMVPPTSEKFTRQTPMAPVLSEIWSKAHDALATATDVAFVGYSFPPTDVQFRMFVLHALSENQQLKRLVVVNSPRFGEDRLRFESHYSGLLNSIQHHHKIQFRFVRFEDWVLQENMRLAPVARAG